MHHLSSICDGDKLFKIVHFFEKFKGPLNMTAHLGGALRRGSQAEPAHQMVEYAQFSKHILFRVGKKCRIHSQACF